VGREFTGVSAVWGWTGCPIQMSARFRGNAHCVAAPKQFGCVGSMSCPRCVVEYVRGPFLTLIRRRHASSSILVFRVGPARLSDLIVVTYFGNFSSSGDFPATWEFASGTNRNGFVGRNVFDLFVLNDTRKTIPLVVEQLILRLENVRTRLARA